MKKIICYEKNVYGRVLIYVEDKHQAKMLYVLTKKTTLDYKDLEALQHLGFQIVLTPLMAENV